MARTDVYEPPPLALSQVYTRTYCAISPPDARPEFTGTCFALKHGDVDYLITAAHVYEFCGDDYGVWLRTTKADRSTKPLKVGCEIVGMDKEHDVAVARLNHPTGAAPLVFNNGVALGSRCQFLGYPFGDQMWGSGIEEFHPCGAMPFIKTGTVSALNQDDGVLILDGLNNRLLWRASGGTRRRQRPRRDWNCT